MPTRRAFTLTEVLLAIALIAAMAGFAATSVGLFSEGALKSKPADRVFLAALKNARNLAAERGEKLSLSYADGIFTISRFEDKAALTRFALSAKNAEEKIRAEVAFVPKYPQIIGTESVEFAAQKLSTIEISPDGTCTPVEVKFTIGDDEPFSLSVDPLCCAEEETPK